jgi:hypothetical protein
MNLFNFNLREASPAIGPVTTVTLTVTWPRTPTPAHLVVDLSGGDAMQVTDTVDLIEGFVLGAADVPADPAALDISIGYAYGYRNGKRARRDSERASK